jgi:amino acid adenylation domain-containing protein
MMSSGCQMPLSLSQREVWLDQRSFPESHHLNVGGYGEIRGDVNIEFMVEAVRRIAAESTALRLLPNSSGEQTLIAESVADVEVLDFGDPENPDQMIQEYCRREAAKPIALDGRRPPWRVVLLKVGRQRVGMMTQFHHIVMDGWGSWLFYCRWGEHYTALCEGRTLEPGPDRDYAEAIRESLHYRESPVFAADQAFWDRRLRPLPEPLLEPRRGVEGGGEPPAATVGLHRLPRVFYDRLVAFASELGVIPYQVFLAVLVAYFSRLKKREEIVLGVPCLNRGGRRYKRTLGMFASVLPLRIRVGADATPSSLVQDIVSELREVYRHQRFPLSQMGRSLRMFEQGRDRLFDVVFSFEKNDFQIGWGSMTGCQARQVFSGAARYPLAMTVCEFEPGHDVEMVFEASASVFLAGEVERLGLRLHHLLERFMVDPNQPVNTLDLVPAEERALLLQGREAVSPMQADLPTFIESFVRQAARQPDRVALVWTGGQLTYGEVDRLSYRWSRFLQSHGARRGRTIAIAMDRGPEVVVSLLAVARTGAAFLLVDPDAPVARTKRMLKAIDAPVVLIQKVREERLGLLHRECHCVDLAAMAPAMLGPEEGEPARENPTGPCADDLAYVVFTSGSTGEPKGVKVSHRGVSHRLDWLARVWEISPADRSGQVTQLTFDPCLIEVLLPLTRGGSVALPPPGRRSAEEIARFFVACDVTYCVFVPTTLRAFLDVAERLGSVSLRLACCGGDALPLELCDRFRSLVGGLLFNLYGPTEASIFVTAWECVPLPAGEPVPLGRALEGVRVQVLDDERRLLPVGAVGEIYLGGVGLSEGYLGRSDLNDRVFVPDPLAPGTRMYRSGDKGYMDAEGNVFFLGRVDRQIKLRGYRIELGEIESVLHIHPKIELAAAKLLEQSSERFLHAWVAPRPGETVSAEDMLDHLRRSVCDFMVPSSITVLSQLPVFSNGKINYGALPEPQRIIRSTASRRPLSEWERQIAKLWEQTLRNGPVSLGDDFFRRGGDSLAAIMLLDHLESLTGRRYPLTLITENPLLEDQAAALSRRLGADSVCVALSSGTELPCLYVAVSGNGDLFRFRHLARALNGVCSVRMLQPTPAVRETARGLGGLSETYADSIAEQTDDLAGGRPWVAGFSVGGVPAMETVRQLETRGVECAGLILIDTVYPHRFLCSSLVWELLGRAIRGLRLQSLSVNGRYLGAMFDDQGLNWQIGGLRGHRLTPCRAPATLVVTSGLARWRGWFFDPWARFFENRLDIRQVSGVHGSIFEPESVDEVAGVIASAMREENESEGSRRNGREGKEEMQHEEI